MSIVSIYFERAKRLCLDCEVEFDPHHKEICVSCGSDNINCIFPEGDPYFGWEKGKQYVDVYGRNIIWSGTRYWCLHGKMFYKCDICDGACIHGEVNIQRCFECNGCPHGKMKHRCHEPECDPNSKNKARYIAHRIRRAIVRGKILKKEYQKYVGCNLIQLRQHIESKFDESMTWENVSEWELDHVMPMSSFDFTIESDWIKCFHYTNYQPLSKEQNLSKSGIKPENLEWTNQGWIRTG